MKASELVEALRKLVSMHGDHEVLCDCGSIHASLSFVGVASETGETDTSFVVYQRQGEEGPLLRPDRARPDTAARGDIQR